MSKPVIYKCSSCNYQYAPSLARRCPKCGHQFLNTFIDMAYVLESLFPQNNIHFYIKTQSGIDLVRKHHDN